MCLIRRSSSFLLFILPMIFFLISQSAASQESTVEQVKLELSVADGFLLISLKNESSKALKFHDSVGFHDNRVPTFVGISIKNTEGKILTNSKLSPSGFWSPSIIFGKPRKVSAETLSTLAPGETLVREIKIIALTAGFGGTGSYSTDHFAGLEGLQFKIKCTVIFGEKFDTSVEAETPWLPYSPVMWSEPDDVDGKK